MSICLGVVEEYGVGKIRGNRMILTHMIVGRQELKPVGFDTYYDPILRSVCESGDEVAIATARILGVHEVLAVKVGDHIRMSQTPNQLLLNGVFVAAFGVVLTPFLIGLPYLIRGLGMVLAGHRLPKQLRQMEAAPAGA